MFFTQIRVEVVIFKMNNNYTYDLDNSFDHLKISIVRTRNCSNVDLIEARSYWKINLKNINDI